jgi:hypothetical protein
MQRRGFYDAQSAHHRLAARGAAAPIAEVEKPVTRVT